MLKKPRLGTVWSWGVWSFKKYPEKRERGYEDCGHMAAWVRLF